MRIITTSIFCLFLSACSVSPQDTAKTPTTFYAYQAYQQGHPLSLASVSKALHDADVVLLGEWHTHPGIHRFQVELVEQLHQDGYPVILAMEQFSRDKQPVLENYLSGEIGEQTLIKEGKAWSNYESDYRALIEYAKEKQLPVIAANAPADIVKCIGREGLSYIDLLDDERRTQLAKSIDTQDSPYKEKFTSFMQHTAPEKAEKMYAAQLSRDATMAESIFFAHKRNPNSKIVLTAGQFHTQNNLAVGGQLRRLDSSLKVVVIDPISSLTESSNDEFQLLVLPTPARYAEGEKRAESHHSGKDKKKVQCSIK